jgi:hypothetical protein
MTNSRDTFGTRQHTYARSDAASGVCEADGHVELAFGDSAAPNFSILHF